MSGVIQSCRDLGVCRETMGHAADAYRITKLHGLIRSLQ